MMDLSPIDNKGMYFKDLSEIQPIDPLIGLCGFHIEDSWLKSTFRPH